MNLCEFEDNNISNEKTQKLKENFANDVKAFHDYSKRLSEEATKQQEEKYSKIYSELKDLSVEKLAKLKYEIDLIQLEKSKTIRTDNKRTDSERINKTDKKHSKRKFNSEYMGTFPIVGD